jgi:uncharacterized membrane protein
MASFPKRLEAFLAAAAGKGLVDEATRSGLLALAREQERERGALRLASVLGWLGGAILSVGVILLVAANWDGIAPSVKLVGLLALLGGAHGAAFWIRGTGRPYAKTAEALHVAGAGLFLAGIGLVAQIYHLNARPPNGILLWFVAVAPLAGLLRSGPLAAVSLFALILWMHMEASFSGSPIEMPDRFIPHLALEISLGLALVGTSGLLRPRVPPIGAVFRGMGAAILFGGVYVLGFYRHLHEWYGYREHGGTHLLPLVLLALGGIGLAVGARHVAPGHPWYRNRLVILLASVAVLTGAVLLVDMGTLGRGASYASSDFGWSRSYHLADWILSGAAWLVWFLLAFWCVGFGSQSGRRGWVNAGVAGVALGAITRFFDLMGGLTETGTLFVVGGLVLIGVAWGAERWRRNLVARMGRSAP